MPPSFPHNPTWQSMLAAQTARNHVLRPNFCAWCGSDRNSETRVEGTPLCCCPHLDGTFVFGSNCAGIHGAGAAAYAEREYGAEYGVGFGPTGRSYAIPTKDHDIMTMELKLIVPFIDEFIDYANERAHETFLVTRIGCGLAGFSDEDIAPLFFGMPSNCIAPVEWRQKWPAEFAQNVP